MSDEHETKPAELTSTLVAYRLTQVEAELKAVRVSVHDLRNSLQPIALAAARLTALEDGLERAFGEIRAQDAANENEHKTLHEKCAANDGEFKKWFNRCVGVGICAVGISGFFGNYVWRKVDAMEMVVLTVPQISANLARQARIQNVMLKRMGVDPDLVTE